MRDNRAAVLHPIKPTFPERATWRRAASEEDEGEGGAEVQRAIRERGRGERADEAEAGQRSEL